MKLGCHLGNLGEYISMYKEDRDINLTDGSSILEVGKTETGQPFFGKCEKMSARLGSHRHQVSRESRS